MAREKHWNIQFKSLNGTQYNLGIYEEDYDGEVVQLTGAATPFTTDEDDDESPFTAIRTQSASIRVIADENTDAINPTDCTSHYVELRKVLGTVSSVVVWQGFLVPQTFSQPWNRKPYEVEFTAISPLGLLETKEMDEDLGLGSKSLKELIVEAFVQTGIGDLYDSISFDDIIVTPWFNGVLRDNSVSRYNWFEENNSDDDGSGDWKSREGQTYLDLMEDVCSFFGLTLVERGKKLHFKAVDAWTNGSDKTKTETLTASMANFISVASPTFTQVETEAKDFADIEIAGTGHTVDVIPGKRKCTVVAQTNKMDEVLSSMNPSAYDVLDSKKYTYSYSYKGEEGGTSYVKARLRSNTCAGNNLVLHTYDYFNWNEVAYPSVEDIHKKGCVISDIDHYDAEDVEDKKNYNYKSGIMMCVEQACYDASSTPTTTIGWNEKVGFEVKSKQVIDVSNGYLCLNISHQVYNGQRGMKEVRGDGWFTIGLRIGGKYWNGSSWQTTPCTFILQNGEDASLWNEQGASEILDTKTLDMDCVANGYMIPVTEDLSGDIEFRMMVPYGCVPGYDGIPMVGAITHIMVTGVNIEYFSPDSIAFNSHTNNTYSKTTNKAFTDEKTTTLHIATSKNNKNGYAILKQGTTEKKTFSFRTGNGTKIIRPEEWLLDRMVNFYGQSARYISVEAMPNDDITPDTKLVDDEEKIWYPLSASRDWRQDVVTYKLLEIVDK